MRIVEYPSVRVNCGQLMVHLNVAHANTIQKKPLYHFTILTAFSTKLSSPIIKSLFWLLKCSNISTIVFRTNKNRNSTYLQRKKKRNTKKTKIVLIHVVQMDLCEKLIGIVVKFGMSIYKSILSIDVLSMVMLQSLKFAFKLIDK